MEKLELLAPAKNYNCAICAINSGADAIYIGTVDYGARKNASNSLETLKKIIDYAHLFNVKVYITINTILDDNELQDCKELIKKLYEIQADAIIFQDFGILSLAYNSEIPPIILHASTQCDNRTIEKIKFFENIGIKRVVLARELPLNKIEEIKKNTNIELEHFIHGALCVCYSGQCYLSEYIGKRSANRGECAQACRKRYSLLTKEGKYLAKNKYLLSLKDNNLSKHIEKLIKAGITSFKIEGRLKDENYVKNIVLFYNNLLEKYPRTSHGKIIKDFVPNPEKSFNRGFCDDYLFNKKDNIYNFITPKSIGEYIGIIENVFEKGIIIKTEKEINPQDGLFIITENDSIGFLVNKSEKIKNKTKIYPNKKLDNAFLKTGTKIYRNLDVKFNKILENSKTTRKLEVDFTVFEKKVEVKDINNNKVSLKFESKEIANNQEKMKENFIKSLSKTNESPYLARKIEFKTKNLPFLPVSEINEIRRKLLNRLSEKILKNYKTKKQKPINIKEFPTPQGGYKLNVHNLLAKEFYEFSNCKVFEDSFEKISNRKHRELMTTKHCLKKAFLGCSSTEELYLEDEKNIKYPLVFDCKKCEMKIFSP